jgi:hypothetical protein
MQPLDPDAELLLREWIEKADADLEVARRKPRIIFEFGKSSVFIASRPLKST